MAKSSLSRTIADTITLSRELREEGEIDGQVKLYNVDDDEEFEADATTFFERTLMTQGLREAFVDLRNTLRGDDNRGTHILYGSYGSGKSHQMVAMHHCFASPAEAGRFGDRHIDDFSEALPAPDRAETVTVSLQDRQPDYLWEPFFDELGEDPGTFDEGGYPDRRTILDAVGDRAVAFLLDELEDWWVTLSEDRKAANRGFLQAYLEATEDPDSSIFAFVSVLREGSEVHDILDRQTDNASDHNMNSKVSKQDVLRHRLIDDIDETAVEDIVDGYVEAYADNDHVPDDEIPRNLRGKMQDAYPFHPVLLNALETRYYADEGNQNTRGMIYLFSKILTTATDPDADPDDSGVERLIDQTDLVTHGDIDAVLFEDELSRINVARPNVCIDDIENRVDTENIPHGRRILNTVLLYSLKPDEGEGADKAEIVMGTFQTGDLVSDIVLNIEQLYGVAWYFHKLNGKYAVRDRQNEIALIQNKASAIDETVALSRIADTVESVFGRRAHAVGFTDGDLKQVPDSRDLKVVVNADDWTTDTVETVIKNADGSPGREWRNALVFVQPSGDKSINSGTGYVEKARYIEGASEVLRDDSLDDGIERAVKREKENEERELKDRVELAYGEILDGDDLLNDFDFAAQMDLSVFVGDDRNELNANDIADSVAAGKFDLQGVVWNIVSDLLDRRDEATVEEVYEQFLRQPTYPIPGSPSAVVDAVAEALENKPVITHGANGFSRDLTGISLDTTILPEDAVERWDADDVLQELKRRFGSGTASVDIGDFELDLFEDTEVWLEGDGHDTVMTAVGRLARDDRYVIYSGTDIITKAQSDAVIRDISGAERIDETEIAARIEEALESTGRANTRRIFEDIRRDESVYLPDADTERAFREPVADTLVDDYVIDQDREYHDSLGNRDPTDVTIVPTVADDVADQIEKYLDDLDGGSEFTVGSVAGRFDGSVSEEAVQTYLLRNLGRDTEPEYVIATDDSSDPTRWSPGYEFRTPSGGWYFKFNGDDVADLRSEWREEEQPGTVTYGEVAFTSSDRTAIPGPLMGTARVDKTRTKLTLAGGDDVTDVRDMLERMPESATNFAVEINFE
jgi:hypothetical protein